MGLKGGSHAMALTVVGGNHGRLLWEAVMGVSHRMRGSHGRLSRAHMAGSQRGARELSWETVIAGPKATTVTRTATLGAAFP